MVKRLSLLFLILLSSAGSVFAKDITTAELKQISGLIFQNECASKESCLTSWNEGEEFASLGIGHFIWYPAGQKKAFKESFPFLMQFMALKNAELPQWLAMNPLQPNPWPTREQFLAARDSSQMKALRLFLKQSKPLQAEFMQQRLTAALPGMLRGLDKGLQQYIHAQFKRVADAPMGMYLLMDYVNFKGEGTSPEERYHGKGWGMLQVLENMSGDQPGLAAIKAFAKSADQMLTRRVELSPTVRNEIRWLPGWRKRLATYARESEKFLKSHE